MAIVINSNISSLTAQRALGESQKMQSTAMERLSSGLRINSAKDDAAGLAIAENFTSQIKGLNQAVRNANDAYSLAQTAEGGLQETTAILQRMRELAVQASNTTLTSADRTAIQDEVNALTAEIDRIATTTQYNSNNILDGSGKGLSFQIGDKSGQTVSLALDSAKAVDLGLSGGGAAAGGQLVGGAFSGTSPSAVDDVLINGVNFASSLTAGVSKGADGVATATTISAGTAGALAAQINTNTSQHGVTATAFTKIEGAAASGIMTGALTLNVTDSSGGNGGGAITIDASSSLDGLISSINNTAFGVSAVKNANGGLDLVSDTGNSIVIGGTVTGTGLVAGTYHGNVTLSTSDNSDISIAIGTNAGATIADVVNMGFNVQSSPSTISGMTVRHHAADDFTIASDDDMTVNGVQIATTRTDKTATTMNAADLAATINAISDQTNVTATARTEIAVQMSMAASSATATIAANSDTVTVNGVATAALTAADTVETIAGAINTAMQGAGIDIVATFSGSVITLVSESGANISIGDDDATNLILGVTNVDGSNTDVAGAAVTNVAATSGSNSTFGGTITLTNTVGGAINLGSANATDAVTRAKWAVFGFSPQGADNSSGAGGVDLSTATKSSAAISAIDAALSSVNAIRGGLGALQNRLDYTISSLQNTVENHSASRSRVMDADFAVESANLAKSQVLAQASTAMLAQANAAPQLALQLLQ